MNPIPTVLLGAAGHRIAHKRKGLPYAFGSNREFVRDKARIPKIIGVDIDITISADDNPWWNHWELFIKRDAWFDPRHVLRDGARIRSTPDSVLRRVRVRYQGARRPMLTALQAGRYVHNVKGGPLIPCFEMKGMHPLMFSPEWYAEHFLPMQDLGFKPVIMSLPGVKTKQGRVGLRKLAAAHEVGLPTMWLWRGQPPTGFAKHVDLVKSRPGRGIYRP